jgi:hypothetical protein
MFTSAIPAHAPPIAATLPWLMPATMPVTRMPSIREAVAIQRESFACGSRRGLGATWAGGRAGGLCTAFTRAAISRSTRSTSEAAIGSSYSGPSSRREASAAAISCGVRSAAVLGITVAI